MGAEKQKTILLVEDEAITALTEKMTLEKYGYNVMIAHTGEEAVATVKKTPAIDLILMDINLGSGIDGTDAASLILSKRDLPVIFLSSHMEPEVVAKTEKITSYGYVVKNSSITVLDASIKMAFKLFEAKTKEREKEKALRESEASYRVMFSGASDGILLADSQTKQFRYANQAICRLMGYTEEELLRISIVDIHPKESLDHVLAEFAALARGEIRSSTDLPCLRKDGTIFYANISHSSVILEGREYHVGFFHDITARKHAEEVVFQSKKDWEDCFDSITDMITIHDNDYNIIRTNKACKMLLKLPEFENNLKLKCFSFYHGTAAPPAGCPSCECLKSGIPGVFELFEPYLNRYLEIRAIPRFDSNNQRSGLIHIVRDITERKRASDVQRESELRLQTQYQGMPVPTFTWQKQGEDFELIDFNEAAKVIAHEKTIELIGRRASDLYADRQDILQDLQQCIVKKKVVRRETLSEHFAPGKLIALTLVPIPPDLVMVHMEDITERKLAEQTLHESEERLRDILFSTADWIWEVDEKGVYTYSSDKGLNLLGASRGDIIGKTPFDFMPPEEAARVVPIFSNIMANKSVIKDLENWNIGRNGEMICLLTNGVPILDEKGYLKGYRGVDKDITERKRAEEVIKRTQWFQQVLLDAIPSPVFYKDAAGVYSGGNKAFERYIGLTREQFIGKTVFDISPADLAAKYDKADRELLENTGEQTYESSVVYADGTRHEVVFHKAPFIDAEGKVAGLVGVILDVSESKRAESQMETALAALKENNSRLEMAMQAANMAWWEMDLASGNVVFEKRKVEMLDFPPEKFTHYKDFMALVHPEDHERAMAAMRGHIEGSLARYEVEYRISTRSGEFKWFYDIGSVVKKDASGKPLKVTGLVINITGRKQAEDAMRVSEAKQSNALQMTKAGHWEYDVDRDVFTFNDNFYRIFRTTVDAVGGYQMSSENYARKFCHPNDMAMVGDETRKAIESTDPNYSRQIEHRILYADGQVGTITVRFFIIKDPQGRTVMTYGVNQDISERKWAEMEITRQLAEKEILLKEVHHRIKNNIASIGGLISLHLQSITNPEAIAVLQDAMGRVNSMRILYDKLLLTENYKEISVKNYIESIADTVIALFPGKAKVTLDKQIADFHLDSKRLFPLGAILNELLTNIMKYAFIKRKTGLIKISLTNVDKHVKLVIQDDGNGLPDGFDINESKGFGLMLVKMLSQQLAGSFSIKKHAGTRCKVEFDV
jgi:PAS domain S-box-containing protein